MQRGYVDNLYHLMQAFEQVLHSKTLSGPLMDAFKNWILEHDKILKKNFMVFANSVVTYPVLEESKSKNLNQIYQSPTAYPLILQAQDEYRVFLHKLRDIFNEHTQEILDSGECKSMSNKDFQALFLANGSNFCTLGESLDKPGVRVNITSSDRGYLDFLLAACLNINFSGHYSYYSNFNFMYSSQNKFRQQFEQGVLKVVEFKEEYSNSESFVIIADIDGKQGFIDNVSEVGAFSQARLFSSIEQAKSMISRSGLVSWSIAKIESSIKDSCVLSSNTPGLVNNIQASIEKKIITDSLCQEFNADTADGNCVSKFKL